MNCKKHKIFILIIVLVMSHFLFGFSGTLYLNAGIEGSGYLGTSLTGTGFDGEDYYFTGTSNVLLPVFDPGIGGGWFFSAGYFFPGVPFYLELDASQTFSGGTWKNSDGVLDGAAGDIVTATMVISNLGISAGWEFAGTNGFIPELYAGTGLMGTWSGKGVQYVDDSSFGGFSGVYVSLGTGSRFALHKDIILFTRLYYEADFFTSMSWDGGNGLLQTILPEHKLGLQLGVKYWLPF